jgi:tRNA dimethylallyltransferase
MNGTKFSDSKKEMTLRKDQSPRFIYDWDILHCYLDIEKDKHYEIIVERSNDMYKNGLVLEVENLLAQGFTGKEKPLKSIGYKETIDFINGMFETKEEYLERLSINTRRLAKSQRTWFKKVDKNIYHTLKDFDKLVTDCMNFSLEK